MKKILLSVFIIFVIAISAWNIQYITSPLNSVEAVTDTVEYLVNDKNAVILREEQVYYSDLSGTLYHNVSEGDRVAKDSTVSTIFGGVISDDNLKELRTIDKKINHRRDKISESSIYHIDGIDTESKITSIINDITPTGENNDVIRISDFKEELNNLRNGIEISDEEILQSLEFEKEAVENRISTSKSKIQAGISGVFTTYTDGLEGVLRPENIENYSIDYLNSLTFTEPHKLTNKMIESDGAVCKVVNNHVWYAAFRVPTEEAEKHEQGENVTLRFNSIAGELVEGEIYRISENDEDGHRLVFVRCPAYFEGAFSYRRTDIDMIFESYTGYKVPIHAIRSDDKGEKYVRAMSGAKEYSCYVNILYTDTENEFLIIESTENAGAKLKHMDSIVTGER